MAMRAASERRRAMTGAVAVAGLLALAAAGPLTAAGPAAGAGRADASTPDVNNAAERASVVAGCRVFPRNNYWNADISQLPVNDRSAQWLSHMSPTSNLHPDFGPSYGEQPVPYGIPVTVVDGTHPKVPVQFQYADESDDVGYPLGNDTLIEGGRAAGGDRHAVVVDTSDCRLFETWATSVQSGRWSAGSGATWSLTNNHLRPNGWTSADAAGLPILPGLLRYRQVEVTGVVDHAIRFTTDVTDRRHIWPARHDAGSTSDAAYPPMGARFRLTASFSTAGYRPDTVVVLTAMKKYGLVLADNGSPWFFQGDAVAAWPPGLLDELKTIPADAFVAVDTAPLQVSPNSAATRSPTGVR